MSKENTGVRRKTSTNILLAKLGLKSLQHVWLLRAPKFRNSLVGKPAGTMYKLIALDCCTAAVVSSRRNWAQSIFRAIRATRYELGIRVDDMDNIDVIALSSTSPNSGIPFGMAWMSALGLALLKKPGVAHNLDGLSGLLTSMHVPYWKILRLLLVSCAAWHAYEGAP